jgi:hypothetical protein
MSHITNHKKKPSFHLLLDTINLDDMNTFFIFILSKPIVFTSNIYIYNLKSFCSWNMQLQVIYKLYHSAMEDNWNHTCKNG